MRFPAILVLAPVLLAAAPAHAEYDTERLFESGAWYVELTRSDSGTVWCSAETENRSGQIFSLTAYDDQSAAVFVFDGRWNLEKRAVRFHIDIDRSRWDIDGTADENSVSVFLEGDGKAADFMSDLAGGSRISVLNRDKDELAAFSLTGSRRALGVLLDCWKTIVTGKDTDPF